MNKDWNENLKGWFDLVVLIVGCLGLLWLFSVVCPPLVIPVLVVGVIAGVGYINGG